VLENLYDPAQAVSLPFHVLQDAIRIEDMAELKKTIKDNDLLSEYIEGNLVTDRGKMLAWIRYRNGYD